MSEQGHSPMLFLVWVVIPLDDIFNTAAQITIIGGAIWSIISYTVVKPLEKNIVRLEKGLDIMNVKLDEANKRSHDLAIQLASVNQSAKSAHKRLDFLTKFCRETHNNFPDKDR